MRLLDRIIRGDLSRRTRLHTRRGELLSRAELIASLPQLKDRILRAKASQPWLAPLAVTRIDQFLAARERPAVLEVGAGVSTPWFAKRASQVCSLEDSQAWAKVVEESLTKDRLNNTRMLVGALDVAIQIIVAEAEFFDLILVDNNEDTISRSEVLKLLAPRVKPGGLIVLDDSDRNEYDITAVQSWTAQRIRGIRSKPLTPTETTLFTRT